VAERAYSTPSLPGFGATRTVKAMISSLSLMWLGLLTGGLWIAAGYAAATAGQKLPIPIGETQ